MYARKKASAARKKTALYRVSYSTWQNKKEEEEEEEANQAGKNAQDKGIYHGQDAFRPVRSNRDIAHESAQHWVLKKLRPQQQ
jgi:hypothetical protein